MADFTPQRGPNMRALLEEMQRRRQAVDRRPMAARIRTGAAALERAAAALEAEDYDPQAFTAAVVDAEPVIIELLHGLAHARANVAGAMRRDAKGN